jgi:hypothetical protein
MTLSRLRRMSRLEEIARPAIEKNQKEIGQKFGQLAERFQQDGLTHASNLSLLIKFGEPQEGEPLERAWDRCRASEAPELRDALPGSEYNPFDTPSHARTVGDLFRDLVLSKLEVPGSNDAEKLIAIISEAPQWLLWFTYADLTDDALNSCEFMRGDSKIEPVQKWARSRLDYVRWPLLPRSAFHQEINRDRWDDLSIEEDPEFYLEPTKEATFARRLKAILERYGHISGFRSPLFDPALQNDPERLEQIFNSTVRHWPYWH